SGATPQAGASIFAGQPFADIPDLADLEVKLQVPQVQMQGVRAGAEVQLYPLGTPGRRVTAKVTRVAATASPISRRSPVKYVSVTVPVPVEAVTRYGWMPGMRFGARIVLVDAKSVLAVPNLALRTHGGKVRVRVWK